MGTKCKLNVTIIVNTIAYYLTNNFLLRKNMCYLICYTIIQYNNNVLNLIRLTNYISHTKPNDFSIALFYGHGIQKVYNLCKPFAKIYYIDIKIIK